MKFHRQDENDAAPTPPNFVDEVTVKIREPIAALQLH